MVEPQVVVVVLRRREQTSEPRSIKPIIVIQTIPSSSDGYLNELNFLQRGLAVICSLFARLPASGVSSALLKDSL